tara:strand:+ start:967 stop:1173 length:207 start_codon:yes stop_codon:yes gene_type:complete
MKETKSDYIGTRVYINNEEWRVAEKVFRYGREWQYILSHETVEGDYKSMKLNQNALERIIESGSKVID